jgi:phosphoglycolate phosphatase
MALDRMCLHLIFDLDGTISDPAIGIARSINYALSSFGYPTLPEKSISQYIGPQIDETFAQITASISPEHISALVGKYRERYAEVGYSENVIYPGVADALERLVARGVPLGLCTSKRVDFAERILALFGIREYFQFVNGGDIGTKKERQLRGLLSDGVVDPRSTMIGDRAVDILAAHANGLRSVAVLWGHGSRAELEAVHPSLLLQSPEQLVGLENAV